MFNGFKEIYFILLSSYYRQETKSRLMVHSKIFHTFCSKRRLSPWLNCKKAFFFLYIMLFKEGYTERLLYDQRMLILNGAVHLWVFRVCNNLKTIFCFVILFPDFQILAVGSNFSIVISSINFPKFHSFCLVFK